MRMLEFTSPGQKKRRGVLHGYGVDLVEVNGKAVGQQTVAIVETELRKLVLVPLENITFLVSNPFLQSEPPERQPPLRSNT